MVFWRTSNYQYFKKHLELLSSDLEILDIGAGRSPFRSLMQRFSKLVSIDFHPHQFVDIVADITKKLPIKDRSFDVIILSNILEHIPYPKHVLEECFRVLRPGGILLAITPFIMGIHEKPYDFTRPTRYYIKRVLEDSGFEKVEIENISDLYNIYGNFQRDFFDALLQNYKKEPTHFLVRILRKMTYVFFRIFGGLLKGVKYDSYPAGYGFSAEKIL